MTAHPGAQDTTSQAQRQWDRLHKSMLDLEACMRAEEDGEARAKLRDQWRFVMMELSELEERHGGFRFSEDVNQTDRERDRSAA